MRRPQVTGRGPILPRKVLHKAARTRPADDSHPGPHTLINPCRPLAPSPLPQRTRPPRSTTVIDANDHEAESLIQIMSFIGVYETKHRFLLCGRQKGRSPSRSSSAIPLTRQTRQRRQMLQRRFPPSQQLFIQGRSYLSFLAALDAPATPYETKPRSLPSQLTLIVAGIK